MQYLIQIGVGLCHTGGEEVAQIGEGSRYGVEEMGLALMKSAVAVCAEYLK